MFKCAQFVYLSYLTSLKKALKLLQQMKLHPDFSKDHFIRYENLLHVSLPARVKSITLVCKLIQMRADETLHANGSTILTSCARYVHARQFFR